VNDRDARLIEVKLEAAFDRYSRAVLSGLEPTPALFIESLEAESLSLSLSMPVVVETAPNDLRTSGRPTRAASVSLGRRAEGLLAQRVRGLL
jgi:hypothetical protein